MASSRQRSCAPQVSLLLSDSVDNTCRRRVPGLNRDFRMGGGGRRAHLPYIKRVLSHTPYACTCTSYRCSLGRLAAARRTSVGSLTVADVAGAEEHTVACVFALVDTYVRHGDGKLCIDDLRALNSSTARLQISRRILASPVRAALQVRVIPRV